MWKRLIASIWWILSQRNLLRHYWNTLPLAIPPKSLPHYIAEDAAFNNLLDRPKRNSADTVAKKAK
jgi:hypothetical protein